MAHKYDHLREKATRLRQEQGMPLDAIVNRLRLPRTTVYAWIKDIPIPRTTRQTEAQQRGTATAKAQAAARREAAYQQGLAEAPDLLQDLTLRDFVVLYMAEGTKTRRNEVEFVNADPALVKLAQHWITQFARNKVTYRLQCHIDHDEAELKAFWAAMLDIDHALIKTIRKSNSGRLQGRRFRSEYGLLSIRVSDTQFRMRLQAWMDSLKAQW